MKILPPPGPARTRQLTTLSVTAVVLALVAWYMFGGSPTLAPAPASNSASTVPGSGGQAAPGGRIGLPEPLKLAALGHSDDSDTEGLTRNPFRYGQPPPPPPPPYVAPPPPPPPPPPQAPDIPLQLVGLETMPGGTKVATVRDPGTTAVFTGAEGQVLDGRYRLVKIGVESIVVSYLDGSGRKTLPLAR
jgi:hypothetical protein